MSDLLNKPALIAAIDLLLNNGVADESITPDLHNALLQDVLDTLYTSLWKKTIVTFGSFSGDASPTANKVFRNLAAGHLNGKVLMHIKTAFVGPGLTSCQITAGVDVSTVNYWGAIDGLVLDAEKFTKKDFIIIASANDLKTYFTANIDLNLLTAGQLDVYYLPQQVIS
jgi:hypothetical protein